MMRDHPDHDPVVRAGEQALAATSEAERARREAERRAEMAAARAASAVAAANAQADNDRKQIAKFVKAYVAWLLRNGISPRRSAHLSVGRWLWRREVARDVWPISRLSMPRPPEPRVRWPGDDSPPPITPDFVHVIYVDADMEFFRDSGELDFDSLTRQGSYVHGLRESYVNTADAKPLSYMADLDPGLLCNPATAATVGEFLAGQGRKVLDLWRSTGPAFPHGLGGREGIA